ncbi:TetR/AcrR family transcriptional regulator [Falsiroseomonas sp. HW251]|uniref:TetR/AcrR family transcriptional regulator n=1 Tax=Falsiroseomonas sp. HW251 TaxID=3390998 RepID=UPI003D324107
MSTALAEAPPPVSRILSRKRRAILDAAALLFCGQGYGAVSMDAVAKAAGVSKATLYAHFTGKDALFAEIVAERLAQVRAETEAQAPHDLPPAEALRAMGRHWLRFMLAPRTLAIYRIVIGEGARFPDLARAFHAAGPNQGRAWLTGWIAEEVSRGRLRADADPRLAAEQMIGLLRGDLYLRSVLGLAGEPTEAEIAAVVDAASDTFLRAFAAPSPAA